MWFLMTEQFGIGIPIFILIAFTDAIDGSLARLRKQITDWGTLYDPIADKLFIGLVVLIVVTKYVNVNFGLVIIIVESLIILGAYFQRLEGKKISANVFGKTKMFLQVLGVCLLLIALWAGLDLFIPISIGTLSIAVVMAVISLFTYGA